MTSWIEPPPKQKGMGCLGKGCLLIIAFLILLAIAFIIGGYTGIRYVVTSSEPKEIPQVETSEEERNAVLTRWDQFETATKSQPETAPVVPAPAPAPDAAPPEPTPAPTNRIELTAGDINLLIANSRRLRGKAFVSIDNNVVRVQVSVPLEKVGFQGRYLNGEFAVTAPPDRNPHNIQISRMSFSGVPEGMLKALLGTRSVSSYVDEYASQYGVSTFTIENNKVIIETTGGR